MLTNEMVIDFLRRNKRSIVQKSVEVEAQLPQGKLTRVLNGERQLSAKELGRLEMVLVPLGITAPRSARIIAVANHKGGVGKTTTTLNLGRALTLEGFRVLLVDLDAQGNLSQSLGVDEPGRQVVDALLQGPPLEIVPIAEGFDLAPSDIRMAASELELINAIGGYQRLGKAIAPERSKYDFIFIDCPPALNIFTNSALACADSCLVTIQPEVSSLKGLNNLFERIYLIRDEINQRLRVEGVLITQVHPRLVIHNHLMDQVKQTIGGVRVYDTRIMENVAIKESQLEQKDIFTYDRNSRGAQDYKALAEEFLTPNRSLA